MSGENRLCQEKSAHLTKPKTRHDFLHLNSGTNTSGSKAMIFIGSSSRTRVAVLHYSKEQRVQIISGEHSLIEWSDLYRPGDQVRRKK